MSETNMEVDAISFNSIRRLEPAKKFSAIIRSDVPSQNIGPKVNAGTLPHVGSS